MNLNNLKLGFDKVFNLLGGFNEWKLNNLKIVLPEDNIIKKTNNFKI